MVIYGIVGQHPGVVVEQWRTVVVVFALRGNGVEQAHHMPCLMYNGWKIIPAICVVLRKLECRIRFWDIGKVPKITYIEGKNLAACISAKKGQLFVHASPFF
jgi:hypothetical protein